MAVPGTQTALGVAEVPAILVPTLATPVTTVTPTAGTSVIPEHKQFPQNSQDLWQSWWREQCRLSDTEAMFVL